MTTLDKSKRGIALQLLCLLVAVAIGVGLQARERANASFYAYELTGSATGARCDFDFVKLDAGDTLPMPSARTGAASDDRGVVLALGQPFELYQASSSSLVASDNGYLAVADSLEREDGSDFSNDCDLPVRADNPTASQNRIYVYHDDLRPQAGGEVRTAFFADCPRRAASGRPEACSVVEWHRFERAGPIPSTVPLVAQAVLYHGSFEIALQYASVDDSRGGQATIGLQGFDGRAARMAGCNTPRVVKSRQAVCFFDPRHRPGNDPLVSAAP